MVFSLSVSTLANTLIEQNEVLGWCVPQGPESIASLLRISQTMLQCVPPTEISTCHAAEGALRVLDMCVYMRVSDGGDASPHIVALWYRRGGVWEIY